MKNKRKLRLAALLAVLLLLFPAFAVEDDITDESDTSTTQTEKLTRPHSSAARIPLTHRQTSRACSTMKRC